MRWFMLLAFILAAATESFVFAVMPVWGLHVPVLLLIALLVVRNRWLGVKQLLLFSAIGGYIVDSMAAFEPGTILLSTLAAIGAALIMKERLEWRARLFVPVALGLQQALVGLSSGGRLDRSALLAFIGSVLLGLIFYTGLFLGAKRMEARVV